jgi:hypothetical protein
MGLPLRAPEGARVAKVKHGADTAGSPESPLHGALDDARSPENGLDPGRVMAVKVRETIG